MQPNIYVPNQATMQVLYRKPLQKHIEIIHIVGKKKRGIMPKQITYYGLEFSFDDYFMF